MPRRPLLCSERKLGLLPFPSSFERGREEHGWKRPVGVQLGQHLDELGLLTGDTRWGRGVYPLYAVCFSFERPKG